MALCITVSGNTFTVEGEFDPDTCTGYTLLDVTEYQEVPSITDLFATPEAVEIVGAWTAGFSLPVILFLVAWGYQSVIGFFNSNSNYE